MIESLHFQYPQYLLAFVLSGVLLVLLVLYQRWKGKLVRSFGKDAVLRHLLPGYAPRRQQTKWWLYLTAFGLLTAAIPNLQRPVQDRRSGVNGLDVIFVLDVSNSMLATDVAPSRLEKARLLISRMVDTLQGNRVGIVAFAGQAVLQLPLTTDLTAARLYLSSVNTQSVPLQGTDIEQALMVAGQSMNEAEKQYKAVILITDGEEHDTRALDQADALKEAGIMLLTVGVGTPNGATITDATGQALREADGQPAISRLNEELLADLSAETYGSYLHLEEVEPAVNQLRQDLNNMDQKPIINSQLVNYKSFSHWLIALALLLLLIDLSLGERLPRKAQFKAERTGTAAIVMIAGCMLANPLVSAAQPENAELRKANEAYKAGRLDEAEALYQKVLQSDSLQPQANFNMGNIAYRKKAFDIADAQYSKVLATGNMDDAKAASVWNNKGLALARQGQVSSAVDAFKQAVRSDPFDTDIRDNLNLALEQQRKQQQRQQSPPPPQSKFNQKQADDRLKAIQQEEKQLRDKMNKQAPGSGAVKEW